MIADHPRITSLSLENNNRHAIKYGQDNFNNCFMDNQIKIFLFILASLQWNHCKMNFVLNYIISWSYFDTSVYYVMNFISN